MSEQALSILYEDNHVIAVNKQPADIVQGDKTGDVTLADRVKEYIRQTRGKTGEVFIGIPHRLDRPTSGVVLFARTSKALERLSAAFREGKVGKTYWALVAEKPPAESGTLVHWLTRNAEQNKSYAAAAERPGAREARLSYRLLFSLERYHLLEIKLETGRHHQIRAQLHAVGCHIKGDLKYGAPRSNPGGGIHLHARMLSFPHPVKKEMITVVADPPRDALWDAVMARATPAVTVHIRYLSGLRETTGISEEQAQFPAGTRLSGVSQWLAQKYGIDAPGPGVMCTLNGRGWSQTELALETQLNDTDEIALFPLLSGG